MRMLRPHLVKVITVNRVADVFALEFREGILSRHGRNRLQALKTN
jgi:hypothetical protein